MEGRVGDLWEGDNLKVGRRNWGMGWGGVEGEGGGEDVGRVGYM